MQATARAERLEYQQRDLAELMVTEIHTGDVAHLTRVLDLARNELVVERTPARTPVGKHVWLEMGLPSGPMRILARVISRSLETTTYDYKHMWPKDRERYADYLVQHAYNR